jgi:EAL domain-containing protein (putative c-di-GMP-specific phosphodiesterase class I)
VGYSSLSYLTAFPFDKVKIDKSFIQRFDRAETQTVMTSIVHLAKSLKLSVVAEGIETADQLEKLKSLGIDFGQGYLLGRPKSATDLIFTRCQPNEEVEAA